MPLGPGLFLYWSQQLHPNICCLMNAGLVIVHIILIGYNYNKSYGHWSLYSIQRSLVLITLKAEDRIYDIYIYVFSLSRDTDSPAFVHQLVTTPCYSYTRKTNMELLEQENLNRQSLSSESVTSSHKSHQHPMNAGIFQSCLLIFTVPRTPRGITYPPSTNRRSHSIATDSVIQRRPVPSFHPSSLDVLHVRSLRLSNCSGCRCNHPGEVRFSQRPRSGGEMHKAIWKFTSILKDPS